MDTPFKPVAAGFVTFESQTRNIHGVGDTAETALADARKSVAECCDSCFPPSERAAALADALGDLNTIPATVAMKEAAFCGWNARWRVIDGVACTYAEATGAEHPDDKAHREAMQEPVDYDAIQEAARHEYYHHL